ncbi:MAG: hypothetical protein AAFO83_15590, partial [Cyanobacteria bacterium J06607_13]
MVDRPIKKSDRDAAQQSQSTENSTDASSAEPRKTPRPIKKADRTDGGPTKSDRSEGKRDDRGRGKGRGKGRGRGKDDAPKAPMNPALMRGPKPTKKVAEPEVEETAAEEVAAEETAPEETAPEETAVASEEATEAAEATGAD